MIRPLLVLLTLFASSYSHANWVAGLGGSDAEFCGQHLASTAAYYGADYYRNNNPEVGCSYSFWVASGLPDGCETEWNNETSSCGAPVPEEKTVEECTSNGQLKDNSTGQCTSECTGSILNSICFPNDDSSADDDDCDSSSSGYQGSIGWGSNSKSVCNDTCEDGQTFGQVNGESVCVNNDFDIPECGEGQYGSVDEYGASCNSFDQSPNDPLPSDPAPNTDTNNDGTPDEYQRENDPNSTDDAVDRNTDAVNELNKTLKEGVAQDKKMLDAIDKSRKDNNSRLDDLYEQGKYESRSGEKLSEKGLVPTLSESAASFGAAITSNSAVQLVSNIVVPTNNNCPVYTLPSTPISSPITMDIHCSILSQHSQVISAMFLFAWSLLALTVFLKA